MAQLTHGFSLIGGACLDSCIWLGGVVVTSASLSDISVVIVNWNCSDDVLTVAKVCSSYGLFVTVVDNGSDRVGELDRLRRELHGAGFRVLRSDSNRGYGGGMNLGLRYLESVGIRYALLLNPDVAVTEVFLSHILSFDRTVRFGAIGVAQASAASGGVLRTYPTAAGLRGPRPVALEMTRGKESGCVQVDVVTGACMVLDVDAVSDVGFFDERYFHYKEEFDLTFRLGRSGFPVFFQDGVTLLHRVGGSLQHGSPLSVYYYFRNEILFAVWNFGFVGLVLIPGIYMRILRGVCANRRSSRIRKAYLLALRDGLLMRFGRQDIVREHLK
ncbi:glycosyltransferase family 2 protein [Gordonia sputi]